MDQLATLLARAFGLHRVLLKNKAFVQQCFAKAYGEDDGRHLYDKLLYDNGAEVDSWYCQLDPDNRAVFLTHPAFDLTNH